MCWAMLVIDAGLLAALENAIGHTEAHMTQLGATIDECRAVGWGCSYHERALLDARARLDRLLMRHVQALDGHAGFGYPGNSG